MEILFILIILAVIIGMIANSKGRSFLAWFLYGLLIFPIAFVHILITQRVNRAEDKIMDNKSKKKNKIQLGIATHMPKVPASEQLQSKIDYENKEVKTLAISTATQEIGIAITNLQWLPDVGNLSSAYLDSRASEVLQRGGDISFVKYAYRDVLALDVVVDGETVTKTARGSQIGGALIGGLVLGGVGAVIGGLSGKTTANEQIKSINLMLTVNDVQTPVHYFTLLNQPKGIKKSHDTYTEAMKKAEEWHAKIKVIIRQADDADQRQEKLDAGNTVAAVAQESLTDKLTKLGELRDKGILTEEEFTAQKVKVLAE